MKKSSDLLGFCLQSFRDRTWEGVSKCQSKLGPGNWLSKQMTFLGQSFSNLSKHWRPVGILLKYRFCLGRSGQRLRFCLLSSLAVVLPLVHGPHFWGARPWDLSVYVCAAVGKERAGRSLRLQLSLCPCSPCHPHSLPLNDQQMPTLVSISDFYHFLETYFLHLKIKSKHSVLGFLSKEGKCYQQENIYNNKLRLSRS